MNIFKAIQKLILGPDDSPTHPPTLPNFEKKTQTTYQNQYPPVTGASVFMVSGSMKELEESIRKYASGLYIPKK